MKHGSAILVLIVILGLAACGPILALGPTQTPASSPTTQGPTLVPISTPTPACDQAGTTETGEIASLEEGFRFLYMVFLPPCYAGNSAAAYPVLYWTALADQSILEKTDRLIRQGAIPAHIVLLLDLDLTAGVGADARLIRYVVPYVDAHYRTLPDRRHRSITGISHGAAIAARAAFQAPDVFGRVAVISRGDLHSARIPTQLKQVPASQLDLYFG